MPTCAPSLPPPPCRRRSLGSVPFGSSAWRTGGCERTMHGLARRRRRASQGVRRLQKTAVRCVSCPPTPLCTRPCHLPVLFVIQARFLVDTGCFRSVIPASRDEALLEKQLEPLFAGNASQISTYAGRDLVLQVGHLRLLWHFSMADVSQPLLGADFLAAYGFTVDVGQAVMTSAQLHVSATIQCPPLGGGRFTCSGRRFRPDRRVRRRVHPRLQGVAACPKRRSQTLRRWPTCVRRDQAPAPRQGKVRSQGSGELCQLGILRPSSSA